MNFIEAMECAQLGMKIRSTNWHNNEFIFLNTIDNDTSWFDQNFRLPTFPTCKDIQDSWEIYLEEDAL